MTNYRIRSTGEVKNQGEVRKMFSTTSLPRVWNDTIHEELGIDPIFEGSQATGGTVYQYSVQQGIEEIDGKWYTKYVLGPIFSDYTDEEGNTVTAAQQKTDYEARKDSEQGASVRSQRDQLLKESDWTQGKDISESISTPWAAYRQELRDVPTQEGFPWTITWPTQPE